MHFEIDQSGRIEETNRDTVIAIANSKLQYSLQISAKLKRDLQKKYKSIDKPKLFSYKTFAIAISLLVKRSKVKVNTLVVDVEYPGYERIIKEIILEHLNKDIQIRFKQIGKNSPAHAKAYFTYKRKLKADFIAKIEELSGDIKF